MRIGTHIIRFVCCLFLAITLTDSALAQASREGTTQKKEELLQGIDRWSFKTNALDWLLTIPNAGVEFDLSSSPYNRSTIGISGRYNWNTWHKYNPPTVFNLWEVKPEYRYYWRTRPKGPRSGRTAISAWVEMDDPKEWRAYWLGFYTSYGGYGMKFTDLGWQGKQASAGFTMGYGLPLYDWGTKGAIDLELGISAGIMYSEYDNFTHNIDGRYYSYVEGSSVDWHILPFPVVSEIRVALAYRTKSIKDKYSKIDQAKIRARQDKEYQEQLEQEAATEAKAAEEQAKAEAKAAKEKAKAAKEAAIEKAEAALEEAKANIKAAKTKEEKATAKEAEEQAKAALEEAKNGDKKAEKAKKEVEKEAKKAEKESQKKVKKNSKKAKEEAKAEKETGAEEDTEDTENYEDYDE